MALEIEALVVSAGEPQLKRCLQAVREQTVPFSNVVHVNNVTPESVAFNTGMSLTTNKWVMKIDGDFILYPNAVEMVVNSMHDADDVFMFAYVLDDAFLRLPIWGCGVYRRDFYTKIVRYPNMLTNDEWAGKKLRRLGYRNCRPLGAETPIATHCEDPDEFQVFRRFFTRGVKGGRRYVWAQLEKLHAQTQNPLYQLAMQAVEFGIEKGHYPTSHNLEYDKKLYEEFNERRRRDS